MDETEIMKHSEKYLQAKWVTENPDGYDERDVVDAKKYCNAYLDGYNQALRIHDVVKAKRTCAKCNSTDMIMFTADLDICNECGCTQDGA